jgi:hypothetical protein
MDAVRRAVATSNQLASGVSNQRRWAVTSGTITVEVGFAEDAGTTCTALVIDLEGSITGDVNRFFTLASHSFTSAERTAKCAMFHVVDKPIVWVRTNITTLTKVGGGDVKVTIDLLSYD